MQPENQEKLWLARQQADAECAPNTPPQIADVDPPDLSPPCAEPDDTADEQFFPANDPPPEITPDRLLPGPLVVRSRMLTVSCDVGQVGADNTASVVNMAAGAAEQEVYLDSIPAIPLSELYRLATRIPTIQTTVVNSLLRKSIADGSSTELVAMLRVGFNLSDTIAEAIYDKLVDAAETADSTASAVALSQLDCVWVNDPMRIFCSSTSELGYEVTTYAGGLGAPPSLSGDITKLEAGTLLLVNHGEFSSRISQADANTKALNISLARGLTCLVTNQEPVTVSCGWPDTTWGGDMGEYAPIVGLHNTDFHTIDTIAADTPPRRLKLTVTIPAYDTRTAARTAEEAQERAEALALAQLDCFFPSPELDISCIDTNDAARARQLAQSFTDEQILDELATGSSAVQRNERGTGATPLPTYKPDNKGVTKVDGVITGLDNNIAVRVTLPAGLFVSDDAATSLDLAHNYALGFLECKWVSLPLVYSCDDNDSDPDVLSQVERHRSGGIYESFYALAYKKPQQMSVGSAFPYPLNFYSLPQISANYTSRIEAGAFESSDGPDFANQQAALVALSALQCSYCNPHVNENCEVGALNWVQELKGVNYYTETAGEYVTRNGGIEPTVWIQDITRSHVSVCSGDAFEVAVNTTFVSQLPSSNLVDQSEECEYGNDSVAAACLQSTLDAYTGSATIKAKKEGGLFSIKSYPDASGVPVEIAANTITAASKLEANTAATALALAQLDCFYESARVVSYCGDTLEEPEPGVDAYNSLYDQLGKSPDVPPNSKITLPSSRQTLAVLPAQANLGVYTRVSSKSFGSVERPIEIKARMFKSTASQDEANMLAVSYAFAVADCFYENAKATVYCGDTIETGVGAYNSLYAQLNKSPDTAGSEIRQPANLPTRAVLKTQYEVSGGVATPVDSISNGSIAKPVVVNARMFQSTATQDEANKLALSYAFAVSFCIYYNDLQTANCPTLDADSSYFINEPGVAAAKLLSSLTSKVEANTLAAQLAAASRLCITNEDVNVDFDVANLVPDKGHGYGMGMTPNSGGAECCRISIPVSSMGLYYYAADTNTLTQFESVGCGDASGFVHDVYMGMDACSVCTSNIGSGRFVQLKVTVSYTGDKPIPSAAVLERNDTRSPTSTTPQDNGRDTTVYRLIGIINDSAADCSNAYIEQHVTKDQKLIMANVNGSQQPMLVDLDTPENVQSAASGAFYGMYVGADGHTYLQGGAVIGGNGGSFTIPDIKIKDTVNGIAGYENKRLYIKVDCLANASDGLMLPGCEVTGATCSLATTTTAGSIPPNDQFSTTSLSGSIYAEVGRWTDSAFMPAGIGSFNAGGCIGNFLLTRV